jgi:hypothetical protein
MALDMELDLMGTQPAFYKLYTQLAFVFAVPETESRPAITATLRSGLARLGEAFPWVAGQVVNTNTGSDGPTSYRIRQFEPVPRLTIKNYDENLAVPTFAQMKDAGFPMSMMKEDIWAPCPTIAALGFDPSKPSGNVSDPAPVLWLQLSLIEGGLVLCINMQHNVCDMMGQAAVIGWLSKACRGESLTKDELEVGNMERRGLIRTSAEEGLDTRDDLKNQLLPPQEIPGSSDTRTSGTATPATAPLQCSWVYFNFRSSSLERLKRSAAAKLPKDIATFVSTDDVLSAFIFRSIIRARTSRLPADTMVTLARAVDARRYLDVRVDYPGILQNMTYTSYQLSTLIDTPVGHIAASMRRDVDPVTSDIARRTRSLATFISQAPNNASKISFTARLRADADVMLSSWSKVPAYEWCFGLGLGTATAVRRPDFLPVESLMYTMPKDSHGGIAVAMCLRDSDLDKLRQDLDWKRHVDFIVS